MSVSFMRETASALMKAGVVVLTIVIVLVTLGALYEVETGISAEGCNIAVLPIEGAILPFHGIGEFDLIITPETVMKFMAAAERDPHIDAVLLEINSPGGTPVAAERIAERFQDSTLPVVGLIGDVAASGGYLVAAATDYLIASPMSDVGSIGVNMSYVEESIKNEEEGLTYVQLTTGKFKDIGTPDRPITEEERELLQADLEIIHTEFINLVSDYRGLPPDNVRLLANGLTMPGRKAIDTGLIDELGGRNTASAVLADILEVDLDKIQYCEYESPLFLF